MTMVTRFCYWVLDRRSGMVEPPCDMSPLPWFHEPASAQFWWLGRWFCCGLSQRDLTYQMSCTAIPKFSWGQVTRQVVSLIGVPPLLHCPTVSLLQLFQMWLSSQGLGYFNIYLARWLLRTSWPTLQQRACSKWLLAVHIRGGGNIYSIWCFVLFRCVMIWMWRISKWFRCHR